MPQRPFRREDAFRNLVAFDCDLTTQVRCNFLESPDKIGTDTAHCVLHSILYSDRNGAAPIRRQIIAFTFPICRRHIDGQFCGDIEIVRPSARQKNVTPTSDRHVFIAFQWYPRSIAIRPSHLEGGIRS